MARKRSDLLAQIQADVIGDRVALSSLLRRCVALGTQPRSETVRNWARWELNGYADAEVVPDYRHVHVALMAVITNNAGYNAITQQIHEDVFPAQIRDVLRETVGDIEELVVPFGVGMLEELASQGTDMHRFGPVWSSVMIDTLNNSTWHRTAASRRFTGRSPTPRSAAFLFASAPPWPTKSRS